jgi:GTP-binding protein HflX
LHTFLQRLNFPDQRTYVGKGKLEEIQTWVEMNPVDTIIFDDELSPSQVRNLEKVFENKKVLDRSLLILNIFSQRARTDQAKRQLVCVDLEKRNWRQISVSCRTGLRS